MSLNKHPKFVRTPGVTQDDEMLTSMCQATKWKIKRIRKHDPLRVAQCPILNQTNARSASKPRPKKGIREPRVQLPFPLETKLQTSALQKAKSTTQDCISVCYIKLPRRAVKQLVL